MSDKPINYNKKTPRLQWLGTTSCNHCSNMAIIEMRHTGEPDRGAYLELDKRDLLALLFQLQACRRYMVKS